MKFAYSGPFHYCGLDPRAGRALPLTEGRYSATSAENYSIGAALGPEVVYAIVAKFGREDSRTRRNPRRPFARGK
jgi:hypothetical protein